MAIKVKVYEIPNPDYQSEEPDAEATFDNAVDALAEAIGEECVDGWSILRIAGGDAVLTIIFEK